MDTIKIHNFHGGYYNKRPKQVYQGQLVTDDFHADNFSMLFIFIKIERGHSWCDKPFYLHFCTQQKGINFKTAHIIPQTTYLEKTSSHTARHLAARFLLKKITFCFPFLPLFWYTTPSFPRKGHLNNRAVFRYLRQHFHNHL